MSSGLMEETFLSEREDTVSHGLMAETFILERGDAVSPSSRLSSFAVYTPSYARADGSVSITHATEPLARPTLRLPIEHDWTACSSSAKLPTPKDSHDLKHWDGRWRHALVFIPTTANKPSTIIDLNHVPCHSPDYNEANGVTISGSYNCPVATTPAISIRSLLLAEHNSIPETSANVRRQETLVSNSPRYENEAGLRLPHVLQEYCRPAEDCSNPVSGAGIGDNSNWNPDWLNNGRFPNTSTSDHIFNDIALFQPLPVPEAQNSLIPDYPAGEDISAQFEDSHLDDFDSFFGNQATDHTLDISLARIGEEPFLTATENLKSPKTPESPIVPPTSCDGSVLAPFEDGSLCTTSGYTLPDLEYHRDQSSTATLAQEPPVILDDQPSSSPRHVADTKPRTRSPKSRKYQCTHSACTARSFRRRSDRDRHMRKHNPRERVFVCKELDCEKRFYRKDKLLDHSRNIHSSGKVLGAFAEENMESGVAFR